MLLGRVPRLRSGLLVFEDTGLIDRAERLEEREKDEGPIKSSCSPLRLGGGEEGPEEMVAVSE
jgi:hypothetical protein